MNDTQRQQIEKLRAEGLSYGKISDALGLSTNTIKTYCRRHGLGGVVATPAPIDENAIFKKNLLWILWFEYCANGWQ